MGVVAAGRDVGAGQAAERQLRAVGAAASGNQHGLDAHLAVCLDGKVNQALVRSGELLGHVAVLLAHGNLDGALAVTGVHESGDAAQHGLALIEGRGVKVAQDVVQVDLVGRAGDLHGVIVALATLGVLGALGGRDHLLEFHSQRNGVDHDVLGGARVDHRAMEGHIGRSGAKALEVDLAQGLAVHGVAPLGAQFVQVEKGGTVADLFVGHKGDLQRGVRKLGICHQAGEKGTDLGHAGLVVCREKRGAVRAHDVLAHKLGEVRHLIGGRLDADTVHDTGDQRAALVVHDVRLHAGGRRVGSRVDVRAQHERRGLLGAGRGGQGRRHIGVLVHGHVHAANGGQLLAQHARHLVLARGRGRLGLVLFVGLGIYLHVAHEALKNITHLSIDLSLVVLQV